MTNTSLDHVSLEQLQNRFLAILPRLKMHFRISFRDIRCLQKKDDLIAEATGLSWKWFRQLVARGKDAGLFVTMFATFAARAAQSGRRITGMAKSKDVMNSQAQHRFGFSVGKLPDFSVMLGNELTEALLDNTRSAVPDQVQFRCDFPSWLHSHSRRNQAMARQMAMGETTRTLARRFKVSAGRVSQLRREFEADWRKFTDAEPIPA